MKDGEGQQCVMQQKGQVRTGLERGHWLSSVSRAASARKPESTGLRMGGGGGRGGWVVRGREEIRSLRMKGRFSFLMELS